MKISSQAFKDGMTIPDQYTLYGQNKIPPLHLDDVPARARSLALVVEEPDAPKGTFNHWILFNLDPKIRDLKENSVPARATQGRNDFGAAHYDGPKPKSGEHHYCFKAFALDTMLPLAPGVQRNELDRELKGHVLASAILVGTYAR
jgi:Raf kinase inhibitor-like YbhB/YbcL family protein